MVDRIEHRTHTYRGIRNSVSAIRGSFPKSLTWLLSSVFSQFHLLHRRKQTSTNSNKLITVLSGHSSLSSFAELLWPHVATAVSVQPLDFRPSPLCFSEELQAGSNAGVMSETANGDLAPHFLPADVFDQLLQHHGQSDSVQWIQGTLSSHTIQAKPGSYLFCEVCSDGASPAIIVTVTAD